MGLELAQLILNGLVTGTILSLGAIGLTLAVGILRLLNVAHGDFLTFGAYVAFLVNVMWGRGLIISIVAVMVASALLAVLLDVVLWRPMRTRKAGFVSLILVSVGVAFVLRHLIFFFFGPSHRRYAVDVFQVYDVFGLRVSQSQMLAVIGGAIVMILVGVLLAKTLLGKGMRALADSPDLASISGINIDRMVFYVWILAGALAGFAGVLQGLLQNTFSPNLGFNLLLPIFAALILGGIGNPYGALLGGMVLGLTMEVSTWSALLGGVPSLYKPVTAFAVLILVLLIRPQGILGKARTI